MQNKQDKLPTKVHSVFYQQDIRKWKEIKHAVPGINDATSYVSSCHASSTSCDFDGVHGTLPASS